MTAQWQEQQEDSLSLRLEHKRLKEALQQAAWLANMDGDAPPEVLALQTEALVKEMLRRGARRQADAREASETFRQPTSADLAMELVLPRQSYAYRIPGLAGWNHNVLLSGPRKTGKTTLEINLAASLSLSSAWTDQASGQLVWVPAAFLDLSQCYMAGNVACLNAEMDADDWRDEFRRLPAGSYNASRIFPLHRRGEPLPVVASEPARAWFVSWLRERHIEVLIIDTWGVFCAHNGVRNLNDDAEVRVILNGLDQIKHEAGVASIVVLIHTPHQVPGMKHLERFKGAGAVGDWADVLWSYVQDEEGTRYLSATGRARIDQEEQSLYFDPSTGLLSWGMTGSRAQTAASRAEFRATEALRKAGGGGLLTEELLDAMGGHRADARKLVKKMASNGELESRPSKKDGARANRYFLPGLSDQRDAGTAGG